MYIKISEVNCLFTFLIIIKLFDVAFAVCSSPLIPVGNCQADGLYSDPNDCSAYFYCKSGSKYHLSCGPQKIFDTSSGECGFINNENCKPGQTIFFANNVNDVSDMVKKSNRPPKVVCYISNWEYCENELIPDQILCDKACYSFADLTSNQTVTHEEVQSPCKKEEPPQYKILCYFTDWDWYRTGNGQFLIKHIDTTLCTHINYAYAVLADDLTIKPLDTWADIENEMYAKILELKKTGVKIILALGGWKNSGKDNFSRLVNSVEARKKFIHESLLKYFETWKFDGLEIAWVHPKCWQDKCNEGPASDKPAFVEFVKEISEAFKPRGLSLSSTVGRTQQLIESGYDIPTLNQYLDYFSVLSFSYHGFWDKETGYGSVLYSNDNLSVNHTIQFLLNKGASANKLTVGLETSGHSYTLANPEEHGLGAPTNGPGKLGEFSNSPEVLAFYEICNNVKRKQWKVEKDNNRNIGPYAYKDDQWVSYDDVEDIKTKARFIKDQKLGGAFIWTLAFDDFNDVCGCGKYPLLQTLSQELRGIGGSADLKDCI